MSAITALHALDPDRREILQCALDGVPISIGYAAGLASTWLPADIGPRLAARRLEQLRREWHEIVDDAVSRALRDVS